MPRLLLRKITFATEKTRDQHDGLTERVTAPAALDSAKPPRKSFPRRSQHRVYSMEFMRMNYS